MRLILDEPLPGAWNMAVDEALLESAAHGQTPTLRIYRWSEPTLSLGYFQDYGERQQHPSSLDCPVVRRSSGGGAILHDRELTYSFTAPIADRMAADVRGLYHKIHGSIVETLGNFGISARMREAAESVTKGPEPFLCFLRRADGDVVVGERKVAGSAQRRRRQAVLQHGSFVLRRSEFAPEVFGVQDLADEQIEEEGLLRCWLDNLSHCLEVTFRPDRLTDEEKDLATRLLQQKHGHATWLHKR